MSGIGDRIGPTAGPQPTAAPGTEALTDKGIIRLCLNTLRDGIHATGESLAEMEPPQSGGEIISGCWWAGLMMTATLPPLAPIALPGGLILGVGIALTQAIAFASINVTGMALAALTKR